MKRPSLITTPHPTPEETAKLLGISKKNAKFVEALVEKWAGSPETIREFGEPLNGHTSNGNRKTPGAKRAPREKHSTSDARNTRRRTAAGPDR